METIFAKESVHTASWSSSRSNKWKNFHFSRRALAFSPSVLFRLLGATNIQYCELKDQERQLTHRTRCDVCFSTTCVITQSNLHTESTSWCKVYMQTMLWSCVMMQEKSKYFNSPKVCVATHSVCHLPNSGVLCLSVRLLRGLALTFLSFSGHCSAQYRCCSWKVWNSGKSTWKIGIFSIEQEGLDISPERLKFQCLGILIRDSAVESRVRM